LKSKQIPYRSYRLARNDREHKCYREIDQSHDFKALLDTIFYRKSLEVTLHPQPEYTT